MPVRLGLTGGIGSGKSTVAQLLHMLGACIIDADAISRACTEAHGLAIPAIGEAFGHDMINAAGALDRERMRSLVFSDPTARHRLEQIVHPLVGIKIAQETQIATASGTPCIVYDIPLLVESAHWRKSLDHILVVDCQSTTQIARVVERSQLQASDVQKIIDSQASRIERLHAADSVLFNDGYSIQALEAKVRQFAPQFGLSFPAPENLA